MSRDPGVPYGSGPEEAAADAEPTVEQPAVAATPPADAGQASASGAAADAASAGSGGAPLAIPGVPADRPELHVAAAFAGGLLLATLLKRLAR